MKNNKEQSEKKQSDLICQIFNEAKVRFAKTLATLNDNIDEGETPYDIVGVPI